VAVNDIGVCCKHNGSDVFVSEVNHWLCHLLLLLLLLLRVMMMMIITMMVMKLAVSRVETATSTVWV